MICNKCVEERLECDCESGNFHYFEHVDPLEDFTEFLLYTKKLDGAYVIAHNGGRLVFLILVIKTYFLFQVRPQLCTVNYD